MYTCVCTVDVKKTFPKLSQSVRLLLHLHCLRFAVQFHHATLGLVWASDPSPSQSHARIPHNRMRVRERSHMAKPNVRLLGVLCFSAVRVFDRVRGDTVCFVSRH